MTAAKTSTYRGFVLVVLLLTLTYGIGMMTAVGGWLGHQNLDPDIWQPQSLPYFSFVFGLGFVSSLALLSGKRWGVYGLVTTWISTGLLNLILGPPFPPYTLIVLGVILVVAFFVSLLPVWPELE